MDDDTLSALDEKLKDVKPLWKREDFRYTDVFSDSDDYTDENYIRNFKSVLDAMKRRKVVEVKFTSGHGNVIRAWFVLLKLEYSAKNDKFRVYCYMLHRFKKVSSGIINIGRISTSIVIMMFDYSMVNIALIFRRIVRWGMCHFPIMHYMISL